MRILLPIAVLALAACDPPLQELYPARYYDIEREGRTFTVRAQYDPFERGWFTRVSVLAGGLDRDDFDLAVAIVEQEIGPQICEGDPMNIEPGSVWSGVVDGQIVHLEDLGAWQFVARCV